MRRKLLVLFVAGVFALFSGCGFNQDSDTASNTDTGEATDTGDDTDDTDETSEETDETSEETDETSEETEDSSTEETEDSSTEETEDSSTEDTTTTGPTLPGPGYTPVFKDAFVDGCAGGDPAKETACRCTIDEIEKAIPYDQFLESVTSPEVIAIGQRCGLG